MWTNLPNCSYVYERVICLCLAGSKISKGNNLPKTIPSCRTAKHPKSNKCCAAILFGQLFAPSSDSLRFNLAVFKASDSLITNIKTISKILNNRGEEVFFPFLHVVYMGCVFNLLDVHFVYHIIPIQHMRIDPQMSQSWQSEVEVRV